MDQLLINIFSLGTILSFLVLFVHSYQFQGQAATFYIFVGGAIVAFLLEYSLSEVKGLYSYQGLPLVILSIPIIIPLGWVISFYSIYFTVEDFLSLYEIESSISKLVTAGIVGLLFGMGIEVLARNLDIWIFHFEAISIINIPIIVAFAWGLSIAAFSIGMVLRDLSKWLYPLVLSGVLTINLIIAEVLVLFI